MTDAELQSKIRRIQLERQLESLMQKPPPPKSKGRELVESILYDTGRDLGKKALTHIGTQALDRVIPGFAASQKKEKGKKNATVNDVRNIVEEIKNASQNGSKKEKPKDEKKAEKEPEQKPSDSKKDEPSSPPPPETPKTGRPAPSGEGYPKGGSGESDSTRKRRFFGGRGRSAGRGARQTKPSGPVRVPDASVRSISREIVLRGSNY
jgi:outer membrane biosynthesis protein TonB